MPAMALGWNGTISAQVAWQAAHGDPLDAAALLEGSEAMRSALESGDRSQVIGVDWTLLFFGAVAGIEGRQLADEIGPGVAASLRETVDRFNQSYVQLLARNP